MNVAAALLYAASLLLLGASLAALLARDRAAGGDRPSSLCMAALAPGIAAVINAAVTFLRLETRAFSPGFQLAAVAGAALMACAAALNSHSFPRARLRRRDDARPPALRPYAATAALLCAFVFAALALSSRHGGIDAWMHWNMKARFVWLAGERWTDIFTSDLPWTHPDYPLLLPLNLASFYFPLGDDPCIVGILFAAVFTAALAGLLAAAVAERTENALLACALLIAVPIFPMACAKQYADVETAYFFLAATVCLGRGLSGGGAGNLALAGLFAAGAASTKNEGLAFAAGVALAVALAGGAAVLRAGHRARGIAILAAFAAAFLLAAWPLAIFKTTIAPSIIIVERTAAAQLSIAPDWPYRLWLTGWTLLKELTKPTGWAFVPFAVGLIWLEGLRRHRALVPRDRGGNLVALPLLVAALGYAGAYLTAHEDIEWLIKASVSRLFFQLWPAVLYCAFLATEARSAPLPGPLHALVRSDP